MTYFSITKFHYNKLISEVPRISLYWYSTVLGSEIHCGLFLFVVFVFTWLFGTSAVPGGLPSTQAGSNSILLMAICWIAVALVLYILRPGSLRSRGDSKPRDTGFVRKFHALVVTEFFICGTCI